VEGLSRCNTSDGGSRRLAANLFLGRSQALPGREKHVYDLARAAGEWIVCRKGAATGTAKFGSRPVVAQVSAAAAERG